MDLVVVATVDSKEDPKRVEVYIFPAEEVRKRFNKALKARTEAGQVNRDNFGMWVALDVDTRGLAASVGSGIIETQKPIAIYSLQALLSAVANGDVCEEVDQGEVCDEVDDADEQQPVTVGDVLASARERVANLLGVPVQSVKLDLKVEY